MTRPITVELTQEQVSALCVVADLTLGIKSRRATMSPEFGATTKAARNVLATALYPPKPEILCDACKEAARQRSEQGGDGG